MKTLCFVLGLVLFACQSPTDISDKLDETEQSTQLTGEQLFITHCSSCHGLDGKLGVSGASDLSKSTLSIQEVNTILLNGRNSMPAMNEMLETTANKDSVINYVIQLR